MNHECPFGASPIKKKEGGGGCLVESFNFTPILAKNEMISSYF